MFYAHNLFLFSLYVHLNTYQTVCSAIFGLKRMKAFAEVKLLIAALAKKISRSEVFYHPVNICIALNGLQGMEDSFPEIRALLNSLMDKVTYNYC